LSSAISRRAVPIVCGQRISPMSPPGQGGCIWLSS
jgi:hypothetical protein